MKRLGLLAALLCWPALAGELRSGHADASPATQKMQDDDAENPGFLWVQQGEALWSTPVANAQSCAGCHGALSSLRGVAARSPAWDAKLGRPVTLEQRINLCRTTHQHAEPFAQESDALLGLSAAIGLQSRGLPLEVQTDGPMQSFFDAGHELYTTRQGQLDLSCSQCHDSLAGQRLGGSLIPQGHANGYPLYRLEWQSMGSLYRRIRNCLTGVRAELYPADASELVAIEVYLAGRARGLSVEIPAVRP